MGCTCTRNYDRYDKYLLEIFRDLPQILVCLSLLNNDLPFVLPLHNWLNAKTSRFMKLYRHFNWQAGSTIERLILQYQQ